MRTLYVRRHVLCSTSMNKLGYNNSLRILLRVPRYCSASETFSYRNKPSAMCVIRRSTYTFTKRMKKINNYIVHGVVNSDMIYSSLLQK